MKVAATKTHQFVGVLMILVALVYLIPFVPRGWVPHDEGMLGQSADQVLRGGLPHVDYEEAYTGGLSWIYAAVFKISGVDLLNVRWFLFAGAGLAMWLLYAIVRRYFAPIGAAFAAWVALGWSFPNYFAGLPSWWLLVCALTCVWSVIRYVETRQTRYLVAAGLAAGVAMAIKQTGVYLLVALVLTLLYGWRSSGTSSRLARLEPWVRWSVAAASVIVAAMILKPRLFEAEGLYLFAPVVACAVVLFLPVKPTSSSIQPFAPLTSTGIATAAAAVPLVYLLIPYALRNELGDFVHGAIVLPHKRVAFASYAMTSARSIVTGIPLLALLFPSTLFGFREWLAFLVLLVWPAAIFLPINAVSNVASYQFIWQSSRAIATLLPIAICLRLALAQSSEEQRPILFVSAAMLAWTALNQFPFAAPIYFCYVAPLAVVAGIAAAGGTSISRQTLLPWGSMLLLFAMLSSNRGHIGYGHEPRDFNTALGLPRAHLKVERGDAELYRKLVFTVTRRLPPGGQLIAGPDCPEVYFLSGFVSPSGTLFDFFSGDGAQQSGSRDEDEIAVWSKGEVIVVNHQPDFSPVPSAQVLAYLRREFSRGETIGPFEVRWR
jgi:Dolichyl-phosphate-mannose-protein mannosyltransferase